MKKTLTTLGLTMALLVPAGTAMADTGPTRQPANGADALLQRELDEADESCGPGYYPREQYGRCVVIRDITPRPQGPSYGDFILGAVATIGLIVLW